MTVHRVALQVEELRGSRVRELRDLWRRVLCHLRWHTWEWAYNDDRSERWRACHYCHRERMSVGFVPVPF